MMKKFKIVNFLLPICLISIVTCPVFSGGTTTEPVTAEYLLKNSYNKSKAIKAKKILNAYGSYYNENKKISDQMMTRAAKAVFEMYGLNPSYIENVSHTGKRSSTTIGKDGKLTIYVARTEVPLGNVFFHEVMHAIAFRWRATYGEQAYVGHEGAKSGKRFTDCRNTLRMIIRQSDGEVIKKEEQKNEEDNDPNSPVNGDDIVVVGDPNEP